MIVGGALGMPMELAIFHFLVCTVVKWWMQVRKFINLYMQDEGTVCVILQEEVFWFFCFLRNTPIPDLSHVSFCPHSSNHTKIHIASQSHPPQISAQLQIQVQMPQISSENPLLVPHPGGSYDSLFHQPIFFFHFSWAKVILIYSCAWLLEHRDFVFLIHCYIPNSCIPRTQKSIWPMCPSDLKFLSTTCPPLNFHSRLFIINKN